MVLIKELCKDKSLWNRRALVGKKKLGDLLLTMYLLIDLTLPQAGIYIPEISLYLGKTDVLQPWCWEHIIQK